MSKKKDILIIVSLFSVAFLIQVISVPNIYMTGDEWLFWRQTNVILANNLAPTGDVFEGASPFHSYMGAVVTLLFGGELNNLRMFSVVFGSLTVPLLYLAGKTIYDRKTGLLSALFLCFSAYYCFRSCVFEQEAVTIFFITAFLYFFGLSEKGGSATYACIAGAMIGLGTDAKYLPVFLIPAVLMYVLWTKKFSFRALLDKRIILTVLFAFIFISPLVFCWYYTGIGMEPLYSYGIERFERGAGAEVRVFELSPGTIFERWSGAMLNVLAWGANFLVAPLSVLFKLSAIFLFLITIFSYLLDFMKREKEGSFLLISLFTLFMVFAVYKPAEYYLLYILPFYFIMLSHLAVKSVEHLRENSYKNIFRIFVVALTIIMLFSSFVTGISSPAWNEGNKSWIKSSVDYIKSDAAKNGYEKHIVIGTFMFVDKPIDYQIYLSEFDASTYSLTPGIVLYERELENTILKSIDNVKPDYIIMHKEGSFYKCFFNGRTKKEILTDYRVAFQSPTFPYTGIVLKRKDIQPSELLLPAGSESGEISQELFERSIPGAMKVGKSYTALVRVKNTRDSRTTFTVNVHSEKFMIFVEECVKKTELNKDSTRTLEFKIVPFREHAGELPITADLYARADKNETLVKVDSVSDYVYLIKT